MANTFFLELELVQPILCVSSHYHLAAFNYNNDDWLTSSYVLVLAVEFELFAP